MAEQRLTMDKVVGYPRVFSEVTLVPIQFMRMVAKNPVATLGKLAILPSKLLDNIISTCCDIQTIAISFSLVNRSTRKAVDESLAFQRVSYYALDALVAMLRTHAGSFFTLEDLYNALCSSPSCGSCGNSGSLIWLLECRRCCMPCLRSPELLPINEYAATKLFGISAATLAGLPAVCSENSWNDYLDFRRLLSFTKVRGVVVEEAGGEAQLMARINSTPQRKAVYESCISRWTNSERKLRARWVAAAPLPYFNRCSGKIDNDLFCAGCRWVIQSSEGVYGDETYAKAYRRYNTVYTTSDLIEHVRTDCPEGQRIWKRYLKESKQ
ncbi:uncharacterized protein EV420DRAFT_1163412 [Desarmillaria tabescens]|uniref:F-box domain-containing protein n=1 Tax=Armillaria tabescens TaxID=1929756 RepID=A0AA39NCS3_ARMTA|nr:uncharacterized protein EV420DRAFT_1163412 [Desarmillaria tabescens]KAK0463247.1 hypothetical protein EV420DRAFT_1163412 [Desarmillaria tabescens]